ncbi:unnamed protein product [Penicillium olsonii]|nr:unnamed protein product [Penicillium olsonii]
MEETLLTDLCAICHVVPPKYKCPRCSIRTCSLPCTRRHKLWSECSGVRDPAAYLKRNELATESAFDRDFNFITGIERTLERADREADNRGIDLARGAQSEHPGADGTPEPAAGLKRKHPGQGLAKGEAGFLRGAEAGGVTVIRAPKGMSRNKQNGSRLHPKHKCLSWTIEWITAEGVKTIRNSVVDTCSVTEAYDRCCPRPKESESDAGPAKDEARKESSVPAESTGNGTIGETKSSAETAEVTAESEAIHSPVPDAPEVPAEASTEIDNQAVETVPDQSISPHRGLFFYLHRPRTTTKKPVLVPLLQSATLNATLRNRTVLEFPTIYALPLRAEELAEKESSFILEEEYLRTVGPEENPLSTGSDDEQPDGTLPGSSVNLQNVDEQKVLEVLKQDLFEPVDTSV